MRRWQLCILVLLLLQIAGYAQLPSGNVFGGYSNLNADIPPRRVNLNGWNASLEIKVLRLLGVVADFSGNYGSPNSEVFYPCPVTNTSSCPQPEPAQALSTSVQEHAFLAGPRLSTQIGKFRPFAEAMIGAAHIHERISSVSFSNTNFAYAAGVGLDYRLSKRVGLRGQVDALQTRYFSTWQSNLRASTGIVIKF